MSQINVNLPMVVDVTPEQLAESFTSMSYDEQSRFFSSVAEHLDNTVNVSHHIQALINNANFTPLGKQLIHLMSSNIS